MTTSTITKVLGAALLAACVAVPAQAEVKIAVVDYSRLAQASPQAKTAMEAIQREFAPKQRELEQRESELKSRQEKAEKEAVTMSPEQRSRTERDLRNSARELQSRREEAQEDLNARRNEEMNRLQKALIEEVRAYAVAQKIDLVIADGVVYSAPTLDITNAVLASLQSKTGGKAPAAAPKPAAK